jgi:hypothetical protein
MTFLLLRLAEWNVPTAPEGSISWVRARELIAESRARGRVDNLQCLGMITVRITAHSASSNDIQTRIKCRKNISKLD